MRIEIANRAYEFRVARGNLELRGRRTAAVCDQRRGRILISSAAPAGVRAELAALAVSEAWKRETIQRPPIAFVGDVS